MVYNNSNKLGSVLIIGIAFFLLSVFPVRANLQNNATVILRPDVNGTWQTFTPVGCDGAGSSWDCVNDDVLDGSNGNTDYVSLVGIGNHSWHFSRFNLSSGADIVSIRVIPNGKVSGEYGEITDLFLKLNNNQEYPLFSTPVVANNAYENIIHPLGNIKKSNPKSGQNWGVSDLEDLQVVLQGKTLNGAVLSISNLWLEVNISQIFKLNTSSVSFTSPQAVLQGDKKRIDIEFEAFGTHTFINGTAQGNGSGIISLNQSAWSASFGNYTFGVDCSPALQQTLGIYEVEFKLVSAEWDLPNTQNFTAKCEVFGNNGPTIILDSTLDGATVNGPFPVFNFTSSDGQSSTLNATLYINGNLYLENSSVANNTLTTFKATSYSKSLLLGNYTWWINITDGVIETKSDVRALQIVDTTVPSIAYQKISTSNGSYRQNWFYVTVTGQDNYDITFYLEINGVNESNWGICGTSKEGVVVESCSQNKTNMADGTYTFSVYAKDNNGNENRTEYRTVILDTTKPTLNYTTNSNLNGTYSRTWVFVNVTYSDPNKGTIVFEWNGVNETLDNNSGDIYWENKTGLSDGSYTYKVYANDTVGNENSLEKRTINLDTTPPSLITNLAETSKAVNSITWNWTNPADADFDHVEVYLDGAFKTNATSNSYQTLGLAADTVYEIQLRPVDTLGNSGAWINDTAQTLAGGAPPSNPGTGGGGGGGFGFAGGGASPSQSQKSEIPAPESPSSPIPESTGTSNAPTGGERAGQPSVSAAPTTSAPTGLAILNPTKNPYSAAALGGTSVAVLYGVYSGKLTLYAIKKFLLKLFAKKL